MEVPFDEMISMNLERACVAVYLRIVVYNPNEGLEKGKWLYSAYFMDDNSWTRDEALDALMKLFVISYDAGYTSIAEIRFCNETFERIWSSSFFEDFNKYGS